MLRGATILGPLIVGVLFAWWSPLARLFDALQPLIGGFSIVAAALLVRLNRTMPTLDWKSIDPKAGARLTTKIVELTLAYLVVFAIVALLIVGLLGLLLVGRDAAVGTFDPVSKMATTSGWPVWLQRATAGVIGWLATLVFFRMGYVVWRDYDIVRLQKHVIDAAAAAAHEEEQARLAAEKLSGISAARLRAVAPAPQPKPWGD